MSRRDRPDTGPRTTPGQVLPLGEVRCPSGILVFADAACHRIWPYTVTDWAREDDDPYRDDRCLDLIISGPDAVKARKKASSRYADVFGAVDERPGRYAYDVQSDKVEALIEQFTAVCDKNRLDARVEVEPERVPLAERARRCVADKGQGSYTIRTGFESYEVIAVAGLPADRPLEVTAEAGAESMIWNLVEVMRNEYRPGAGRLVKPGSLRVDGGAIVVGDASAVGSIDVTSSVDGLSDIELETRKLPTLVQQTEFPFPVLERTTRGWRDLEPAAAHRLLAEVQQWRADHPQHSIGIRHIQHSTQWLINKRLAESPWRAGAAEAGAGSLILFETTVGAGGFPLWLRRTTDGATPYLAMRIS